MFCNYENTPLQLHSKWHRFVFLANLKNIHNPINRSRDGTQIINCPTKPLPKKTLKKEAISHQQINQDPHHIPNVFQPNPSYTVAPNWNTQTLPNRLRSWFPPLWSLERELIENFQHQELQGQGSTVNDSNYLLKKSLPVIFPKSHHTLTTPNQTTLGGEISSCD